MYFHGPISEHEPDLSFRLGLGFHTFGKSRLYPPDLGILKVLQGKQGIQEMPSEKELVPPPIPPLDPPDHAEGVRVRNSTETPSRVSLSREKIVFTF